MLPAKTSILPLLLVLCACGPVGGGQRTIEANVAGAAESAGGAGLERAALESGAIQSPIGTAPQGLYQTNHENDVDSLCLVPRRRQPYRFGIQVAFGETQRCAGRGHAKRVGETLILSFDDSPCVVVAQYEGDRIDFPGALDRSCDALCTDRGSLAGVSIARVSNDPASTAAVRDRRGRRLCEE